MVNLNVSTSSLTKCFFDSIPVCLFYHPFPLTPHSVKPFYFSSTLLHPFVCVADWLFSPAHWHDNYLVLTHRRWAVLLTAATVVDVDGVGVDRICSFWHKRLQMHVLTVHGSCVCGDQRTENVNFINCIYDAFVPWSLVSPKWSDVSEVISFVSDTNLVLELWVIFHKAAEI